MKFQLHQTTIRLHQGDITQVAAEAIVNAANSALAGGGGVDGAIHRVGGPAILAECRQIKGGCFTGSAVSTTAGRLPAQRVIHAVGPVWQGGRKQEAKLLGSAYSAALFLAEEEGLTSIAFPALSTGAYGYPVKEACVVALAAVLGHLQWETVLCEVIFVLFSGRDYALYQTHLQQLFATEPNLRLLANEA
ncbi:MAG: O-acetyl-ADP-ribose deacetylase [Chloroflexi bacterium]|nr:O-acetyl-ADP-ribose deacetylase [Chloroflexota bacterium]